MLIRFRQYSPPKFRSQKLYGYIPLDLKFIASAVLYMYTPTKTTTLPTTWFYPSFHYSSRFHEHITRCSVSDYKFSNPVNPTAEQSTPCLLLMKTLFHTISTTYILFKPGWIFSAGPLSQQTSSESLASQIYISPCWTTLRTVIPTFSQFQNHIAGQFCPLWKSNSRLSPEPGHSPWNNCNRSCSPSYGGTSSDKCELPLVLCQIIEDDWVSCSTCKSLWTEKASIWLNVSCITYAPLREWKKASLVLFLAISSNQTQIKK